MALFNLFGNKKVANSDVNPVEISDGQDLNNENENSAEDPKDEESKKHLITITWGTGMPIDVIFHYIQKNYEEHLEEIENMEQLLADNDPKMTSMIESYKRGFMKGINAATVDFINANH